MEIRWNERHIIRINVMIYYGPLGLIRGVGKRYALLRHDDLAGGGERHEQEGRQNRHHVDERHNVEADVRFFPAAAALFAAQKFERDRAT